MERKMISLSKSMVFIVILFCSTNLFAQSQNISSVSSEFKRMDIDQNGLVDTNELQVYQAQTFNDLDLDKNKYIDTVEVQADLTDVHKLADKNQDGKITQVESVSQFNEYFNQMDKNQDGKVSEAEYTDYWKLIYKF